jgi:adenosylcobinamide-GDP ribazoletransferase
VPPEDNFAAQPGWLNRRPTVAIVRQKALGDRYAETRAVIASMTAQLRLATSFLTILPVGRFSSNASDLRGSFGWFPLIGFLLGATLVCMDCFLSLITGGAMRSTLLVLVIAVVTGGLHLDGLADTADALGAGYDRQRALTILHDSRIGAFGTAAVFFVLTIKIVALASATHSRLFALYLAPGIARWSMVAVSYNFDYLRIQGAGSQLLGVRGKRNLILATVITLVAILPVPASYAARGLASGLMITLACRIFYARWLGGVTGDLVGAAGEVVEAAVLAVMN